ncbi:thiamine pyrophosphate-dependent dehydrogenase E1 component subunit alpha [Micromonospora sp. C72]|uniref:thiamine pyrophosphate-dependent dehydrogenase E1 component subunit alpha n=1 Tax=Micromonospora sp. C72 TaxID=2824880 RepID=UPI001B35C2E7|nr:thiamine pyrophosphate-dependent dehydrogenase E1 component subunit alpha [Micromonospora sp. C72]MBQ1043150.1 thiamine pyrophosphate-dependent dehydrogenase E1 component subunit alpha [Micromonospora sp. C72]
MTGSDPLRLYRTVRLIRRFEERAIELVRAGEIVGGIHPYLGQEGIAAGVCAALDREDLVTGTHRGHGHVLAKGADPARMLAELCGRVTGLNRGRGGSMHAADFGVGVLGAVAEEGGAVNEGMLLEAFNLAALWRVPVLFVCENNGYATTMPVEGAVAGTIAGRATAFGMPAAAVDGQDPEAVREVTAAAVARMRAGGGPELIEARTYRFDAHHTFEHQVRLDYRPPEEVAEGRSRDPVDIAGARLDPAARAEVDAAVEAELDAAVEFALAGPHPDPATALDHLYASGLTARTGGG